MDIEVGIKYLGFYLKAKFLLIRQLVVARQENLGPDWNVGEHVVIQRRAFGSH